AILYQMLTGKAPFEGDTPIAVARQVAEAEPPRPRLLNRALDRDLETICLKCLEKEPTRRYRSAAALADDLERWQTGKPIEARPISSAERLAKWARRRPAVAALSGLIILLIAAGALAFLLTQSRNQHALQL